ncbi:hypothetical protein PR048_013315 [Dryococelus australis]|uniref:DDE-1 domain-containing protein n=1 Tax=Dryococelus australis TaxID=614101 RepID=A0ABQ9HRT7_9NEOP|nr:hypothetical protein PR048_013315 [Dryococelus australis]
MKIAHNKELEEAIFMWYLQQQDCGEKLSADPKAAENFVEKFKIEAESYNPEFLNNADETALFGRFLPKTTLSSKRETSAPGHKNQPKSWMTAALFTEWHNSIFIPEVKKYQKAIRKEGSNIMLILDTAPTHPTESLLDREYGRFKTHFLPPNITSLLQLMDQLVIETMKRHNRRPLLRKILIEDENEEGIVAHHQKLDLKDCAYMSLEQIEKHFNQGGGTEIERRKKKREKEEEEREEEEDEITLEDLRKILLKIPGCSECSAEDVGEWLAHDSSDPGFQILSDEHIQSVREETDQEDDIATESNVGPSAGEAFVCLDTALT